MHRPLSIYLDLVRFSAATLVMLSHLGGRSWTGGVGWQFTPFGAFAVDVFFVLSGFTIAFATDRKEHSWTAYGAARAIRIYSVVLPTLLITAILGSLGATLHPELDWGDRTPFAYLMSTLFLDQLWFWNLEPGNNGPFWSLCYEVWYYLAFGFLLFAPARLRWLLAIAALVVAGPKIALMVPVWAIGVAAYRIAGRWRPGPATALLLWAASTAALGLTAIAIARLTAQAGPWHRAAFARDATEAAQFALDYAIGLCMAANFLAIAAAPTAAMAWLRHLERPIRWLAGSTFTLYLLHYPLARFLVAISPWPIGTWQQVCLVYAGTLLGVLAVAQVTERQKQAWRKAARTLFQRVRPSLPAR